MAHRKQATSRESGRLLNVRTLAIAALAVCGIILFLVSRHGEDEPMESQDPGAAFTPDPAVPASVRSIAGRWLREDGGYVLEIREARLGGHLEAAYFNPRPIHVSRAAWMERTNGLQIFVELNDVGYPGATYMLMYDPDREVLSGTYTQPQYQQEFEVEFVRPRE